MPLSPCSSSVSSLGETGGTFVSGVAICALDRQLNVAVLDPRREHFDGLEGRQRLGPATGDVEQRAVPGALDRARARVELALCQRPVVVGAPVLDRVELAVLAAKDADLATVRLHQSRRSRGELVRTANADRLGHGDPV